MSMFRKGSVIVLFFLLSKFTFSQLGDGKIDMPNVKVRKSGPYVGAQRGKYWMGELGAEFQWKQVKLVTAVTQSVRTGFNYDFNQNILGYDLGYWIKPSRLGLTYGGNLIFRSNFNQNRVGFAPVIGYKLFGFHLQTSFNFLSAAASFKNTNTFFVSLRFVMINQRDIKIDH
jgi:hypothetical protein